VGTSHVTSISPRCFCVSIESYHFLKRSGPLRVEKTGTNCCYTENRPKWFATVNNIKRQPAATKPQKKAPGTCILLPPLDRTLQTQARSRCYRENSNETGPLICDAVRKLATGDSCKAFADACRRLWCDRNWMITVDGCSVRHTEQTVGCIQLPQFLIRKHAQIAQISYCTDFKHRAFEVVGPWLWKNQPLDPTALIIIQPILTVTEEIFIRPVEPQCSVNHI